MEKVGNLLNCVTLSPFTTVTNEQYGNAGI